MWIPNWEGQNRHLHTVILRCEDTAYFTWEEPKEEEAGPNPDKYQGSLGARDAHLILTLESCSQVPGIKLQCGQGHPLCPANSRGAAMGKRAIHLPTAPCGKHIRVIYRDNCLDITLKEFFVQFGSVQSFSRIQLFATPWTAALQASLSITNSRSLLKLMSIESVIPSNHLILCRTLIFPPSIFPSIRVFSNDLVLHIRWPKYWSFSFSISPSNEYSGLISFRMDWLDLLAVQGTLKSLLQHHSSKVAILQCSAFFIVQLSHLYMTTGKTIALTMKI